MSDINDTVYLDAVPDVLVCPMCGKQTKVDEGAREIFDLFDRYHQHCSICNRVIKYIIKEKQ